MSNRKRQGRKKRKQRSSGKADQTIEQSNETDALIGSPEAERVAGATAGGNGSPSAIGNLVHESRSERRDREAREALVPLDQGERPTVITVAAIISATIFILSVVGFAVWDIFRDDARPPLASVLITGAIFGAMAWGLWNVRYWAALGFQTLLMFALLSSTLGLLQAETLLQAFGSLVFLVGSSLLFYRGIKAMARIQMPSVLPPDRR